MVVPSGLPHDPGYFKPINGRWQDQHAHPESAKDPVRLARGDVVLGIGYDELFNADWCYHLCDRAHEAGAAGVWSFASWKSEEVRSVPKDNIYIDQQWQYGDADVTLPGYDVKILPTSGVLGCSVYLMINAEVHHLLQSQASAGSAPRPRK